MASSRSSDPHDPDPLRIGAIDFRLHYETSFGQSIVVLGNVRELGCWVPEHALVLHYDKGWWRGRLLLSRRQQSGMGGGSGSGSDAGAGGAGGGGATSTSDGDVASLKGCDASSSSLSEPRRSSSGPGPGPVSPLDHHLDITSPMDDADWMDGGRVEYKYALRNDDTGELVWEHGCNRVLAADACHRSALADHVELRDSWRPPENQLTAMFSTSAFTDAIFSRNSRDPPVPGRPVGDDGMAPSSVTDPIRARLRVFMGRIHPNHHVFVSGGIDELGNWDPLHAVRMSDHEFPLWTAEISVRSAAHLPCQYKFLVLDSTTRRVIKWEQGQNRTLEEPEIALPPPSAAAAAATYGRDIEPAARFAPHRRRSSTSSTGLPHSVWNPPRSGSSSDAEPRVLPSPELFSSHHAAQHAIHHQSSLEHPVPASVGAGGETATRPSPAPSAGRPSSETNSDTACALGVGNGHGPVARRDSVSSPYSEESLGHPSGASARHRPQTPGDPSVPISLESATSPSLNPVGVALPHEVPELMCLPPASAYKSIDVWQTDNVFRSDDGCQWKGAGVAVPVFSLRSSESMGVGEFLDLKLLVDFAVASGLQLIQLLPINDTIMTGTWRDTYPYNSVSVIALHPMYVRISAIPGLSSRLLDDVHTQLHSLNTHPPQPVDYEAVMASKLRLLRAAFAEVGSDVLASDEYAEYFARNRVWLEPYAAFSALRDRFGVVDRSKWAEYQTVSREDIGVLVSPSSPVYESVKFWCFVQYQLHTQLSEAASYAKSHHVVLKGDLPIGVSRNSVDAWLWPHLFHLDMQSGAPPDAFSSTGQNWDFPTYNWDAMAANGYAWWRERLTHMSQYFQALRIDHILGFFRIFAIPRHCVNGLLGHFQPAVPLYRDELERCGVWDFARLTRPYLRPWILEASFGRSWSSVASVFMQPTAGSTSEYEFIPQFDTERKLVESLDAGLASEYPAWLPADARVPGLLEKLLLLVANVVLIDCGDGWRYHPRINMHETSSFAELPESLRGSLYRLYIDYFYSRQEGLWSHRALEKLPTIVNATRMLVCGEDLGMVPACVPAVMEQAGVLSLEVQRMPKDPAQRYGHPPRYPYASVCTTSSHDTSTLRAWWEEDPTQTQEFARLEFGAYGDVPREGTSAWMYRILEQHAYAPSMWAVFPIQDLMDTFDPMRAADASQQRINDPSNPRHYWRWACHKSLDDLVASPEGREFSKHLRGLFLRSGRLEAY